MSRSSKRRKIAQRATTRKIGTGFEVLESRQLLTTTLGDVPASTLLAGAPMYLPLDGLDTQGGAITYTVSSSNSAVSASVMSGTRSLKLHMQWTDTQGATKTGDMVMQLFENEAPIATARIIELTQQGFYNNLIFHRVIKNFMIQGGDPQGTGSGGTGTDFDDQFNADMQFTGKGLLAMAKSNDDTNDSQFFITSDPTRWLDFNHTIFGRLVEGDDVREEIENLPVDGSDKPLHNVTILSATITTDPQNAVLKLKAPIGTTGTSTVTVNYSDTHGFSSSKTVAVTVQADTNNNNPFLGTISPISASSTSPTTVSIPAQDVEGDAMYYAAFAASGSTGFTVSANKTSGQLTITPQSGVSGAKQIYVAVGPSTDSVASTDLYTLSSSADVQLVTVNFATSVGAPTLQLSAASDTGTSSSDRITNRNNSSSGKTLSFTVTGVTDGATVAIYDGSTQIASDTVPSGSGGTYTLTTNGTSTLTDGSHSITAKQTVSGTTSAASAALAVTIDTAAPAISSTAVAQATNWQQYTYDAQNNEESSGTTKYTLSTAPSGMTVGSSDGKVTWTPAKSQVGTQSVSLLATDAAGNASTPQTFQVSVASSDKPGTPTVALASASDTGTSTSDLVTNRNNSSSSKTLTFTITGVVDGATVKLYDGTTEIGSGTVATGSNGTMSLTTNGTASMADGARTITAKQSITDSGTTYTSDASTALTVTVDSTAPTFTSTDVTDAKANVAYSYDVQTDDETSGSATYTLTTSPTGMTIGSSDGKIAWTPTTSQGGAQSVTVQATDKAGNVKDKTFSINVVAQQDPTTPPTTRPTATKTQYIGNHSGAQAGGWTFTVDGDTAMPIINGKGYAELKFADDGTLVSIDLYGTDTRSGFAVRVTAGTGGDGRINVFDVAIHGKIKEIGLENVNLVGKGLSVEGAPKEVRLGNVVDGAAINLGARFWETTSISADKVGNVVLNGVGWLKGLSASYWKDGAINASRAESISITKGDLGADVNVGGRSFWGSLKSLQVTGGNLTGAVSVSGLGGSIHVAADSSGNGGSITSTMNLRWGAKSIVATGGDIHLTNSSLGRLNTSISAQEQSIGGKAQGGNLTIDGSSSSRGRVSLEAQGGNIAIGSNTDLRRKKTVATAGADGAGGQVTTVNT